MFLFHNSFLPYSWKSVIHCWKVLVETSFSFPLHVENCASLMKDCQASVCLKTYTGLLVYFFSTFPKLLEWRNLLKCGMVANWIYKRPPCLGCLVLNFYLFITAFSLCYLLSHILLQWKFLYWCFQKKVYH